MKPDTHIDEFAKYYFIYLKLSIRLIFMQKAIDNARLKEMAQNNLFKPFHPKIYPELSHRI